MSSFRRILPYLALGSGILALSFSAIFVRWATAPAPVISLYRIGLAALFLSPVFFRRLADRRRPIFSKHLRWAFLLPVAGGVFTALDHAVWTTSLQYTAVANSTLLNNTAPIWVALFAWLVFREQLRRTFWIGLILTMAGAVAVLGSDFLRHPALGWGDLIALASGFFYGGYFLITQKGRQYFETLPYTWMVAASSAMTLLGISLALKMPLSGFSTQTYLAFLGAALVSQIGGYLSVSYALGHLPASVVSPTMLAQPVLTAGLALILLGESVYAAQAIGGMTVLAGIYLIHRSRQKDAVAEPVLVPAD